MKRRFKGFGWLEPITRFEYETFAYSLEDIAADGTIIARDDFTGELFYVKDV